MASAEQEIQLENTVVEDGATVGVKRYFTIPGRDPFDSRRCGFRAPLPRPHLHRPPPALPRGSLRVSTRCG